MNGDKKLVDGAGQFYKFWSFWGIILLGVLPFLEEHTFTILGVIPPEYQRLVQLGLALVVAVLRFIKQSGIKR